MRINDVHIIKIYLSAVNGGYVSRMSRLFTPTGGVGSGRYDEGRLLRVGGKPGNRNTIAPNSSVEPYRGTDSAYPPCCPRGETSATRQ